MVARGFGPLTFFVQRDDAKTVVPDRPFAPRRALRTRIKPDAHHVGAGQHRLSGIDDSRFASPVRADEGGHAGKINLLDSEQIPIDNQNAPKFDHAVASSSAAADT